MALSLNLLKQFGNLVSGGRLNEYIENKKNDAKAIGQGIVDKFKNTVDVAGTKESLKRAAATIAQKRPIIALGVEEGAKAVIPAIKKEIETVRPASLTKAREEATKFVMAKSAEKPIEEVPPPELPSPYYVGGGLETAFKPGVKTVLQAFSPQTTIESTGARETFPEAFVRTAGSMVGLRVPTDMPGVREINNMLAGITDKDTLVMRMEKQATWPVRVFAGYPARFALQAAPEVSRLPIIRNIVKPVPEDFKYDFTPTTTVQKLLIGEEPLKNLSEQSITYGFTSEALKKAGVPEELAGNVALSSALLVGAFIENPFVAGVGSAGKRLFAEGVTKMIAEETGQKLGREAVERIAKDADRIFKLKDMEMREGAVLALVEEYKRMLPKAETLEQTTEILRGTKGLTADQIMQKYPDIQLKRDVPATDIYGNKIKVPEGEALTPYELKGNKILLQDGETYIVSKNQYQNIKNNAVGGEIKEFAPELRKAEEPITLSTGISVPPVKSLSESDLFRLTRYPVGKDVPEDIVNYVNAAAEELYKVRKSVDESIELEKTTQLPKEPKTTFKRIKDFWTGKKNEFNLDLDPIDIPDETRMEWLKTQLQDKMTRLNVIQENIKRGRALPEELDAYLTAENYVGRAAERISKLEEAVFKARPAAKKKSLIERMTKDDITLEELSDYLKARHAPEYNELIAKRNPKLPDGGSGLTNAQALKILENADVAGKTQLLEKYAEEFYQKVTRKIPDILEESGLITPEAAKNFRNTFDYYVPMKRVVGEEKVLGRGKGFSVSGKEVKRARGSTLPVQNPVVQGMLDLETMIVKAEKNKVGKSFLKLVQENPNPKLWSVESLSYSPTFKKVQTGVEETRPIINSDMGELVQVLEPRQKWADNVLEVRENGKIKLITIHDKALAQAMKDTGVTNVNKALMSMNGYLRAINTTMNPEFIITNFERDLQTALIHITGEQSARMAKNVVKDIPSAMKGIYKNVRGTDVDNEWSKLYDEMKLHGGKVGWFNRETVEQTEKNLLKEIQLASSDTSGATTRRVINSVGEYVNNLNEVVESAVRLSAYKNAVEGGASKAKAAQLAKNLTVNFNKKGNWGTALNSAYLFSNAGIQGTARIIKSLKNPRTRKMVMGIIASGYGLNEMNRVINPEEWERISDYDKQHYWIVMTPHGIGIKLKLPWGYNVFKNIGDLTAELIHGDSTLPEISAKFAGSLDEAFNPLSSGSLLQMASPTIGDPAIQWLENKTFFGSPIRPEQPQFGAKKPESTLYWNSVREPSRLVTKWLNEVTGGSEVEKGMIDISPELIDHVTDFVGGGLGKFFSNVMETGVSVSKGDYPEFENIPILRQFISEPSEWHEKEIIRDTLDKSGTTLISEKKQGDFLKSIKRLLENKEIDVETSVKYIKDFQKNQARIKAYRVIDELKSVDSQDKRAEIIGNLSALEQTTLVDIIKKKAEEVKAI